MCLYLGNFSVTIVSQIITIFQSQCRIHSHFSNIKLFKIGCTLRIYPHCFF
ncbi:unnamed protein product [Moneuplotes crassus]|uniref:Uncharacterized protein n=1 Tax=Euplotes crassus TaxID=5936 RepID=A0AAD2D1I3_EUPCR|nr:unnamed protein product [Moneuplotes crassus]